HRMTFTQKGSDLISVPVAQHNERTDKVRSVFAASCSGSVACDAFDDVCRLTTISSHGIDGLLVAGSGSGRWTPTGASRYLGLEGECNRQHEADQGYTFSYAAFHACLFYRR